jgi:hypothetical protein
MDVNTITTLSVQHAPRKFFGVYVGRVVDVRQRGRVLVDFPGNPFGPAIARLTRSVSPEDARAALRSGAQVMLTFERGDPGAPILFDVASINSVDRSHSDELPPVAAQLDEPSEPAAPSDDESRGASALIIAKICGIRDGLVEVRIDDSEENTRLMRTAVRLRDLASDVLVALPANGDPVIVGQLYETAVMEHSGSSDADVVLRGNRIRIEGECELTLKAGNCEIHLDARGKATTVADHVVSRARGVNKVQGGSVRLN